MGGFKSRASADSDFLLTEILGRVLYKQKRTEEREINKQK